jgi:diguanylate cyclase (GGDEF)-like protein
MPLDFPTIVVVEGCLALTVGLLLVFTWLQNRHVRGLVWWGVAYLAFGGSIMLLIGGAARADFWLINIGWMVKIAAVALMWSAARQFDGQPIRIGWVSACALIILLASLILGDHFDPNLGFAIVALLSGAFLAAAAFEIWRGREEPLISRWPAIVLLVFSAAVTMARVPLTVAAPIGVRDFTLTSGWLAAGVLAALVCETAIAFLVIAMAKERVELRHKLAARIDPLTGLGNRREFNSLARRRIRRERDDGTPIAMLIFDLDDFKRINDRFGHATGDRVLRIFATAAHQSLRPTDIVCRLGGEEFAALLSVADTDDAVAAADRVRIAFASAAKTVDDRLVGATVSVGVAMAQHGYEDLPKLLGRADEALYQAKARGRNRVEVATEGRPRLAA